MSYEFNQEQNKILARLSYFMRGVGSVYVVLGLAGLSGAAWILYNLTDFPHEISGPDGAVLPVKLITMIQAGATTFFSVLATFNGLLFRRAAVNLKLVVKTQGNDIDHLMEGLGNLRYSFGLLYYILLLILLAYSTAILVPLATVFLR